MTSAFDEKVVEVVNEVHIKEALKLSIFVVQKAAAPKKREDFVRVLLVLSEEV